MYLCLCIIAKFAIDTQQDFIVRRVAILLHDGVIEIRFYAWYMSYGFAQDYCLLYLILSVKIFQLLTKMQARGWNLSHRMRNAIGLWRTCFLRGPIHGERCGGDSVVSTTTISWHRRNRNIEPQIVFARFHHCGPLSRIGGLDRDPMNLKVLFVKYRFFSCSSLMFAQKIYLRIVTHPSSPIIAE